MNSFVDKLIELGFNGYLGEYVLKTATYYIVVRIYGDSIEVLPSLDDGSKTEVFSLEDLVGTLASIRSRLLAIRERTHLKRQLLSTEYISICDSLNIQNELEQKLTDFINNTLSLPETC